MQQVARGRIDMGGYSVTAGSLLVPELSLLNIPFLFKDQKEQDCVTDNHLTKVTQDLFLKKGVVMISWSEVGVADIIGKKPYLTPDDLKGLKARSAPNKVAGYMWTQFGANPNPLPVTEWNSAFQTGLIDVADSAPTFYFFSGLAKLAPVVTMTQHQDQGGVVIMNKEAFDKLTPEQKAALTGTSTSAPASQLRAEVRGFEGKIREMHKEPAHHRRAHPRATRRVAQGHRGGVAEDGRGRRRRGRCLLEGDRGWHQGLLALTSLFPLPESGEKEKSGERGTDLEALRHTLAALWRKLQREAQERAQALREPACARPRPRTAPHPRGLDNCAGKGRLGGRQVAGRRFTWLGVAARPAPAACPGLVAGRRPTARRAPRVDVGTRASAGSQSLRSASSPPTSCSPMSSAASWLPRAALLVGLDPGATGIFAAQKLSVFALVIGSFAGIGIATATGSHIVPRFAHGWVPAAWGPVMDRLADVPTGSIPCRRRLVRLQVRDAPPPRPTGGRPCSTGRCGRCSCSFPWGSCPRQGATSSMPSGRR